MRGIVPGEYAGDIRTQRKKFRGSRIQIGLFSCDRFNAGAGKIRLHGSAALRADPDAYAARSGAAVLPGDIPCDGTAARIREAISVHLNGKEHFIGRRGVDDRHDAPDDGGDIDLEAPAAADRGRRKRNALHPAAYAVGTHHALDIRTSDIDIQSFYH